MTTIADPYGAELSAAWQAAHAARDLAARTVVSLFAGAGGSSLGYAMAGYRELLTVEWDDHAAACLARNLPGVRHVHADIADVSPDILDLQPGELDVLDGSPPCQGFSTAGLRLLDDSRNQLFREYARLLRAWRPKVLVMENVFGLVRGKMRPVFAEIMRTLTDCGYRVTAQLVEAQYLRVPQNRRRVIIIGVRDDLDLPPITLVPESPIVPVGYAWQGMTDLGIIVEPTPKMMGLVRQIPPGKDGADALQARGGRGSYFTMVRLRLDRPAPTMTKNFKAGRNGLLHPAHNRFLSSRELARVQSFPDEYDWADSTYTQIHERLGNSVAPLMMRSIARKIRARLDTARET